MLILSYITTSIVPYAIYYSDDLNFIFTFLPVRASTADDAEFSNVSAEFCKFCQLKREPTASLNWGSSAKCNNTFHFGLSTAIYFTFWQT